MPGGRPQYRKLQYYGVTVRARAKVEIRQSSASVVARNVVTNDGIAVRAIAAKRKYGAVFRGFLNHRSAIA